MEYQYWRHRMGAIHDEPGGLHSAAKIGTVADFGPIPKPRKNLEMNICHQVFVKACQKQARALKQHVMKIVPRRPGTCQ